MTMMIMDMMKTPMNMMTMNTTIHRAFVDSTDHTSASSFTIRFLSTYTTTTRITGIITPLAHLSISALEDIMTIGAGDNGVVGIGGTAFTTGVTQ